MTQEYVCTHTPWQIAEENSLEEIDSYTVLVSKEFDGSDGGDIFGDVSTEDMAYGIMDLDACRQLIAEWYADTPEDERPDPEALQFAFHVYTAQAIKREAVKDHHPYKRQDLGFSDIATLVIETVSQDGLALEALDFGEDGRYSAYIVDMECEIPDTYERVITHDGRGWLRVYDDEMATYRATFEHGIRIYRRRFRCCIIQLL